MADSLTPKMPAEVQKTAYFIGGGATVMYGVDAESAVRQFPHEWRFTPWAIEDVNRYRQEQYQAQVETAAREGKPVPPSPPELAISDEDQAALNEDAQRRQEANDIVAEDDRRRAEVTAWDAKVAAARALLASPAPQPAERSRTLTAVPEAERDRVVIPDKWQDEGPQKRRTIAIRLGAPNTVKADNANEYIEAELKRRSGATDAASQAQSSGQTPAPKEAAGPVSDADRSAVEISNEWRDQSGSQRRAIAIKLGESKNVTTEQADAAIENELKRRADAAKLS